MLNLCNFTVRFVKSKDYIKLIILILVFAFVLLIYLNIFLILQCIGGFLLLLQIIFCLRWPLLNYKEINYVYNQQQSYWQLLALNGMVQKFLKHNIILDCGLFFLLEFTLNLDDLAKKQKIILIIFFDQITYYDYRKFCILEKIY